MIILHMMTLSGKIYSAEALYRDQLEAFFVSVYPSDHLLSHGLDHHRRVWGYAKELLRYSGRAYGFDLLFIQKLIIACYLHDIGMIFDPGVKHGHHSREFCRIFLRNQNLEEKDYHDLLTAIENHDNKEYPESNRIELLAIFLSVADDLDAFGEEGISRYLEIYRIRGIDETLIGAEIKDNAKRRFDNFIKAFGNFPDLVEKHKERYLMLKDHFPE